MKKLLTIGALALATSISVHAKQDLNVFPTTKTWNEHTSSLLKFWLHEDAKGTPEGNFPTWRCDDGSLRNQKFCKGETEDWGFLKLSKFDYVRMQARQTFAYGALFNLTGNKEALRLHKAGVKFLLENVKDKDGGFHSLLVNGKPLDKDENGLSNNRLARTTQDLSYALVGLAMNAYLTHDKKIIEVIKETQKYIYDTYYDKEKNLLKWNFVETHFDKPTQLELVALLDQLNGYMLLTWPVMSDEDKKTWGADIKKTIDAINQNFYNKEKNRFFGCIDNDSCFIYGKGKHLDNGHSVKSFWMEYLAARGLNDKKLEEFAKKGMVNVLNTAIKDDKKGWKEDLAGFDASWWVYAELDQAALTLALSDDYTMPDTLKSWIDNYTDKENGELKNFGLKTHFWRNGFHSSEHALIGTIVSNAVRYKNCTTDKCRADNSTKLYFAPVDMKDDNFTPYYYKGKKVDIKNDGDIKAITFSKVTLPDALVK